MADENPRSCQGVCLRLFCKEEINRLSVIESNLVEKDLSSLQLRSLRVGHHHVSRLHSLSCQQLFGLSTAFRSVSRQLESASDAACRLTGKVRLLQTYHSQLQVALQVVVQLTDLANSAQVVKRCLQTTENLELAAKHIATFRNPPSFSSHPHSTVLKALGLSAAAQEVISSLKTSEQQLVAIVKRQFEQAIAKKDTEGVSRSAKLLFPLGIEKDGILRFIQFIRHFVNEQCAANFKQLLSGSRRYVEVLTEVFVSVADIIQQHQQNIEEEFGPANFIAFCRGLQEESDIQTIRILDHYHSQRRLSDDMNLKDLDTGLDEVAMLSQRCQQFDMYLRKCSKDVRSTLAVCALQSDTCSPADGLLPLSALTKRMQEIMGTYVTLEFNFMQRSLKMALGDTDEVSWEDAEQLTSTCVEDTFFIFHKSVSRAISASDVFAVCAVVNHVSNLLSTEVKTSLEDSLQRSKPLYAAYIQEVDHLVNFVPREAVPDAMLKGRDPGLPLGAAFSWTHSLNNIQACCDYMERFQSKCQATFDDRFPSGSEGSGRTMFSHTLQSLESVKAEFESLHSYSCKLTLNILKTHLAISLQPLATLNYNISQEEYNDYQVNDPFMKNFINALRLMYSHLQQTLNASSVNLCVQFLVEKICRRLETSFREKQGFTLLGGVQLDTDVRTLMSFCTDVASQSIRSKFGRLIEMGDLLNLGSLEELRDLLGPHKTWRLTAEDMQEILKLRVDFPPADVDAVLEAFS